MPRRLSSVALLVLLLVGATAAQVADDDYSERADDEKPPKLVYDPNVYSSTTRDFTARCFKLAQYSGEKACEVFDMCCSTDNVLSKLNGDKCQLADPTNGCNLDISGTRIQWSQCRAFNCTEEITTTTTTTPTPRYSNAPVRIVFVPKYDFNGVFGLKTDLVLIVSSLLAFGLPLSLISRF